MASSVTLRSNNVFLPGQDAQPAIVTFDQASGKITAVQTGLSSSSDNDIVWDFGDLYVLPGGVDAHVHLNEPGRTEWEGFATGTRAAASGGVTTLIDVSSDDTTASIEGILLTTLISTRCPLILSVSLQYRVQEDA